MQGSIQLKRLLTGRALGHEPQNKPAQRGKEPGWVGSLARHNSKRPTPFTRGLHHSQEDDLSVLSSFVPSTASPPPAQGVLSQK